MHCADGLSPQVCTGEGKRGEVWGGHSSVGGLQYYRAIFVCLVLLFRIWLFHCLYLLYVTMSVSHEGRG